jgi:hypothetical protein
MDLTKEYNEEEKSEFISDNIEKLGFYADVRKFNLIYMNEENEDE